jgi:hypothetical protein
VNAEEINFNGRKGIVSNAEGNGDSRDESAEFTSFIMRCSETYVPRLFMVGCQECPNVNSEVSVYTI